MRYLAPDTILAGTGAGTGLEKMARYPANRNRISGTPLACVSVCLLVSMEGVIIRQTLRQSVRLEIRWVAELITEPMANVSSSSLTTLSRSVVLSSNGRRQFLVLLVTFDLCVR